VAGRLAVGAPRPVAHSNLVVSLRADTGSLAKPLRESGGFADIRRHDQANRDVSGAREFRRGDSCRPADVVVQTDVAGSQNI